MPEEDLGPDWVVRRYECGVEKQFLKLRNVLKGDVSKMNVLLGKKSEWEFSVPKLAAFETYKIDVVKEHKSMSLLRSESTVSFTLENQTIHVAQGDKELFK